MSTNGGRHAARPPRPTSSPAVRLLRRLWRTLFAGTPGRMRLYGGAVGTLCVLFGLLSGLAAWSSSQALVRAKSDTEQVVRADQLAANLLLADAIATDSYLQAGSQDARSRSGYDQALVDSTALVAQAAAAQPGDAQALAALNSEIEDYSELAEYARAANRQGLVVGQRYQQDASTQLRTEALPLITAIREANIARLGVSGTLGETTWPRVQLGVQLLLGVVTAVALVVFWRWLARRTHRRLNKGLALAVCLTAVGLVIGVAVQGATVLRMQTFQEGRLQETTNLSQARTAIYDARANESLTLIARGSGQGPEEAWQDAVGRADSLLAGRPGDQARLADYTTQHRRVRELDDSEGDWAAAVELAVDPQASRFAPLERELSAASQDAAARAGAALDSRLLLQVASVLLPLLGLLAAAALARGLTPRIEEYL